MSYPVPELLESAKLASEVMKQLITLSSALLAVSVTFSKEFLLKFSTPKPPLLYCSWSGFCLAIIFALWSLMAITGTLAEPGKHVEGIFATNILVPTVLAMASFLISIVLLAVFGIMAMRQNAR